MSDAVISILSLIFVLSMVRRITIANQKGGVGKTTDTINIGGALNERGADVLLVDLDPQGNLTDGVGLADEYTAESPNFADGLLSPDAHDLPQLVTSHAEFDVLAANIDMFTLESDLVTAMRGREALSRVLEGVEGYDVILVDSPPSLGILTDNALLGTEGVVIPALAEDTSIRALRLLSQQIDTLESEYNTTIRELAVAISRVEYPLDGEEQAMIDWFNETYAPIPVVQIRKRVAIKRAYNDGVSIFRHGEDCDQDTAFLDLADAILGDADA